jgi:hypothetical protein
MQEKFPSLFASPHDAMQECYSSVTVMLLIIPRGMHLFVDPILLKLP